MKMIMGTVGNNKLIIDHNHLPGTGDPVFR